MGIFNTECCGKAIIVPFKKVPIDAISPYKCSYLDGDFLSINGMHSDMVKNGFLDIW